MSTNNRYYKFGRTPPQKFLERFSYVAHNQQKLGEAQRAFVNGHFALGLVKAEEILKTSDDQRVVSEAYLLGSLQKTEKIVR